MVTAWVEQRRSGRVAGCGGGFGGLARFIAGALPDAQVEVVAPHPHPAVIAIAASTPNVRFVSEFTGEYDLLVATDLLDHVPDPIGLVAGTAEHLRIDGQYLIANCFKPVILCHLPQLFYFNSAWDAAMQAMGLQVGERVKYGRAYRRQGERLNVVAARKVAECGRKLYEWIHWLPRGRTRAGLLLMRPFCPQGRR